MSEPTPHKPDGCKDCPLYTKGRGFVLGQGDAKTAKYAIILEAPGVQELPLVIRPQAGRGFLATQQECDKELATRRRDYPDMEERFIKQGLPVAGPTGFALFGWVCKKLGILREECYIDNTIRCLAPKGKDGAAYPKGEDRKAAELYCRQYDRLDKYFGNRSDLSASNISNDNLQQNIQMSPLQKEFLSVNVLQRKEQGISFVPSTILLEGMSRQGSAWATASGVSSQGMSGLQEDLHTKVREAQTPANRGVEEDKVLQQVMRGEDTNGESVLQLEGRSFDKGGISVNSVSSASTPRSEQLCERASVGDGEDVGKISQVHGSSSPSERNQNGQSTGELGDRKNSTSGSSRVSSLREGVQHQVAIVSLHPASILREITPLPLLVKDFEKLRDFTNQGCRCVMLLGGKAAHGFLRYASNVTKWRGTYQELPVEWPQTYKYLFEYVGKRKKAVKELVEGVCGKKHKGKKKAPTCGYIGCVDDFKRRTNEIPSISAE